MTKNITTNSNRSFPLFQSHLDLAHSYWAMVLQKGDTAVDATCGNGHDTLYLAKTVLTPTSGAVYAFDIQETALTTSEKAIREALPECADRIRFYHQSHAQFPQSFKDLKIKLFIYNLGYLPGADKSVTTMTDTTLESIAHACELVVPGGLISITCYPGHPEGALEEKAIVDHCERLNKQIWSICHHRWLNRVKSPSLLLLQKNGNENRIGRIAKRHDKQDGYI